MEKLIDKRFETFDYTSRYTGVPYFYDPQSGKDVYGIGQQIQFNTPYIAHQVKTWDTLDSLALKYYNNPTYWWVIAYFNKINDPFIQLSSKFSIIKIPNLASIVFKD
jgi:hypothetical protein